MDWPGCEYKTNRARLVAKFATGLPDDYICEPGVCRDGKIIGLYSGYNYGSCPDCGGTGEAKELTADQAAEYLRENAPDLSWVEICPITEGWGIYYMREGDDGEDEIFYPPDGNDCWGIAQTLTAALNAAARAVHTKKSTITESCTDFGTKERK